MSMPDMVSTAPTLPMETPSIFEEDWKQCIGANSLDALDINNNFLSGSDPFLDPELFNRQSSPSSTIEPCLSHENMTGPCKVEGTTSDQDMYDFFGGVDGDMPTPASFHSACSPINPEHMSQGELDALFDPFGSSQQYPTPAITNQAPAAPYFDPSVGSVDQTAAPYTATSHHNAMPRPLTYTPSPLREQMSRRSVSEPPSGPPDGFGSEDMRHQPLPRQMVFHRQGHYIGKPVPDEVARIKGRTRGRPLTRYEPYKSSGPAAEGGRSRSRKLRIPPTSAPKRMAASGFDRTISPSPGPAGDTTSETSRSSPVMSIAISVEQLQGMIMDAVSKAVGGLREASAVSSIEAGGSDPDTIVVGSRGHLGDE